MSENYNLQPDTNSQTVRNGDSYNLDTREKLEADLREWIDIATYKAFTPRRMLEVMHHWLYRQAAITIRECTSEDESCCEACRAAQKRKIAELTAERDILKELVARFDSISSIDGIANLLVQFEDLTAERDELREALDACGTGTMYELWRKDHARLEAIRAALHDKPGT